MGGLERDRILMREKIKLIRLESKEIQNKLGIKSEGFLYFIPFLLNGKKRRKILEKEIGVEFINLGAGSEFLSRRFKIYNNRAPLRSSKTKEQISPYCAFKWHPGLIKNRNNIKCGSCRHYREFVLRNLDNFQYTPNE